MKLLLTAITTLSLLAGMLAGQEKPSSTPGESMLSLQPSLENAYNNWRNSMIRKDFKAWQSATASYRAMETRNRIVSQRLRFPDALFIQPLQAPALQHLVLLNIFAKGDTANAIYFGKPDFGISDSQNVSDNFMVLKFIRESGTWKYDNLRIIKFGNDADVLLKIRNQDYSFLLDPTFQPTGVVPPTAHAVDPPDYLAELWIAANGFEVVVDINNGNHRSRLRNDDGRDLVIGGLDKALNTIQITISPVPTKSTLPKRLEIGIYSAKAADKPATRVFHYNPDPSKAPATYTAKFPVEKSQ